MCYRQTDKQTDSSGYRVATATKKDNSHTEQRKTIIVTHRTTITTTHRTTITATHRKTITVTQRTRIAVTQRKINQPR